MAIDELDFNLLRSLHRLLELQSVTGAARSLGIGQPAMSKHLERLRHELKDPLVVRRGNRLHLTERAKALRPDVQELVQRIGLVLSPPAPFVALKSTGVFTVAMGDDVAGVVLPAFVKVLATSCPRVDVRIRALGRQTLGQLDSGEVDAAVVPDLRKEPSLDLPSLDRFVARPLYEERFAVASRTRRRWTLEAWLAASHVLPTPLGENDVGLLDRALASRRLSRRVALTVPSFGAAARVVEQTDLIATLPRAFVRSVAPSLFLAEPPLSVPMPTPLLVWHPRHSTDPRHRFLRQVLVEGVAVLR
ncbi:MAG: LysR family transcriptional regulator [Deltaproteobacteria bacterium]|jgi:DNA-binding transcriptional LysR family regulator